MIVEAGSESKLPPQHLIGKDAEHRSPRPTPLAYAADLGCGGSWRELPCRQAILQVQPSVSQ